MTDALLARHSPADRVAFGSSGERSAADLLRDAAAVANALPDKTAARPLALMGVRRDVYACTAALLGAWSRGYEVLVPPADATREGFLRMAQRADVGAVLHDTASSAGLPIPYILDNAAPEQRLSDLTCAQEGVLHFAALEAAEAEPALRVTGSQLLREAAVLGRSLALPERAAYACSLQVSTRYAWAAGVFWPLLSGGSVLRDDPRNTTWAEQAARGTRASPRDAREPSLLAIDGPPSTIAPARAAEQTTGWIE
ncbi:MAG TPA: hypothetical protein VFN67_15295, partial [Polyangiales bacterium]|nr:hypothetical protein [Polyangiales bacterium]